MAARQKYPTAHDQLRVLAVTARAEGLSFECFWERAVRPGRPPVTWRTPPARRPEGCVVWPNDTFDRQTSVGATLDPVVRSGWERSYLQLDPLPADRAFAILAPLFEAMTSGGLREESAVASLA